MTKNTPSFAEGMYSDLFLAEEAVDRDRDRNRDGTEIFGVVLDALAEVLTKSNEARIEDAVIETKGQDLSEILPAVGTTRYNDENNENDNKDHEVMVLRAREEELRFRIEEMENRECKIIEEHEQQIGLLTHQNLCLTSQFQNLTVQLEYFQNQNRSLAKQLQSTTDGKSTMGLVRQNTEAQRR